MCVLSDDIGPFRSLTASRISYQVSVRVLFALYNQVLMGLQLSADKSPTRDFMYGFYFIFVGSARFFY